MTYLYDPATLVLDTETVSHDLDANGTPEFTRVIDRSQDNLLRPTGYSLSGTTPASGVGGGAPPQPESATSYAYNPTTGRLETVSNLLAPGQVFPYSYTPGSDLIASVASPAHTVTNAYDPTRDVLLTKENKAGATVVSAYGYTVNSLGQRTGVSQTGTAFAATRSIAWGYDPLDQVVKADSTIPGLDRAYQYDLIGNRIKSADSLTLPAAPNYTTNALNQYSSIQNPQSPILNPSYDADGNATAYPLPANLTANSTLTWDAENRMISSTVGTNTTTYQYDSGSRRIAQTTGGISAFTIYDGWNPIAEYSSPNLQSPISHVRSFLWGMDLSGTMQGAGGVGGLLSVSEISNSQISNYFPTYDGNGNVSEYLDSTGAVQAHYEYDPFGRTTVATGAKAQDFAHRFSTKPLDEETGLYYYGYRYYDPVTGRWPSRDPIEEEGGVNLYGFVGNNALNYWDYLGLKDCGCKPDGTKIEEEQDARGKKCCPDEIGMGGKDNLERICGAGPGGGPGGGPVGGGGGGGGGGRVDCQKNPNHPSCRSVLVKCWDVANLGAAALLDGINPFGSPYRNSGYDYGDSGAVAGEYVAMAIPIGAPVKATQLGIQASKQAAKSAFKAQTQGQKLRVLRNDLVRNGNERIVGVVSEGKRCSTYRPKGNGVYSVGPHKQVDHYRPAGSTYSVNKR